MTSGTGTAHLENRRSDTARIRNNQRRCRARRKEYITNLEQRYRECSRAGAAVSVEIQAAARKVLDENRRLRALLLRKGVSETEIDICLGGLNGGEGAELERRIEAVVTCGEQQQQQQQQQQEEEAVQAESCGSLHSPSQYDGGDHYESRGCTNASSAALTPPVQRQPQSSQPRPLPPSSPGSPEVEEIRPYNTTLCTDAAIIIQGMTGSTRPEEEIRSVFGCGPKVVCHVSNSKVLEVMEQYVDR